MYTKIAVFALGTLPLKSMECYGVNISRQALWSEVVLIAHFNAEMKLGQNSLPALDKLWIPYVLVTSVS